MSACEDLYARELDGRNGTGVTNRATDDGDSGKKGNQRPVWRRGGGGSFGTGFWAGTGGMSRDRIDAVLATSTAKRVAIAVVLAFVVVVVLTLLFQVLT